MLTSQSNGVAAENAISLRQGSCHFYLPACLANNRFIQLAKTISWWPRRRHECRDEDKASWACCNRAAQIMIGCMEALLQMQQHASKPQSFQNSTNSHCSPTLEGPLFIQSRLERCTDLAKLLEHDGVQPRQCPCLCTGYAAAAGGRNVHGIEMTLSLRSQMQAMLQICTDCMAAAAGHMWIQMLTAHTLPCQ